MDINKDKSGDTAKAGKPEEGSVRVKTHRSGIFTFQVGIDDAALASLFVRVEDAHHRFNSVPVLPDIAGSLEQEVVASSVFGTNTIEGGTLTEEETEEVLRTVADPAQAKEEAERRVLNIRAAYSLAEDFAADLRNDIPPEFEGFGLLLEEYMLTDLHGIITDGLTEAGNIPGKYRNNPKGQLVRVGNAAHGGEYVAPKCLDDIKLLMGAFLKWINSEPIIQISPLIRAPLAHYYFERIHPFGNGNGRVGRVVEAMILLAAGYKFAPFALSRHYMERMDEYYIAFRQAEKAEQAGAPSPNTPFVEFFLSAMLGTINRLHDRVNVLIGKVLMENMVSAKLRQKEINTRQYTILNNLPPTGIPLKELRAAQWYQGLYASLTTKTRDRDLKSLQEQRLVFIDEQGVVRAQRL